LRTLDRQAIVRKGNHRIGLWWGAVGWLAVAASLPGAPAAFAPLYEKAFREAEEAYERAPTNAQAAWIFARACYDLSEVATNKTRRAEIAHQGIAAARAATTLEPNLAPAHYYLGMSLGVLADVTRGLSGLKLVSEMEASFNKARDLDPAFDYAGPDRCLGLLYRDAPGWPISVGSRPKARQYLEQACQRAGNFPENQLNLLVAWLKWGEKDKVLAARQATETMLAEARRQFTGEAWALSWYQWDRTWRDITNKAVAVRSLPPAQNRR
jgi:hypothetical protein